MINFEQIKNEVDCDFKKEMKEIIEKEFKKQYKEYLYEKDRLVVVSFSDYKNGIKNFIIENIKEFDFEVVLDFNDTKLYICFYPTKPKNIVVKNHLEKPHYRISEMFDALNKILEG